MEDRITVVADIFLRHYDPETRLLEYQTPFQLLIAVALSAQTTDAQVNKILPDLFGKFPDAASLCAADQLAVEDCIRSVGFYRTKARNIIAAAKKITQDFKNRVPDTMDELTLLPGIGRKSASVILFHIYGKPAIIVDTHFGRVVRRLGFSAGKTPELVERDIAALLEPARWGEFSMTANLHGRAVCNAKKPNCPQCPVLKYCPTGQARMRSL